MNSLRMRLTHLLEWLATARPDVVALQETKVADDKFPAAEIEAAGYRAVWSGEKSYNGVATLSRLAGSDPIRSIPAFDDSARRLLATTVDGIRVVNVYVPNGQAVGTEKYAYKLRWLGELEAYLRGELAAHPRLVVLGDFNVAPEPRDVYDPRAWEGRVLFSDAERAAFQALLETGLRDSFRLFDQPPAQYTWWDYRVGAFRRNLGLRIDHILVSPALAEPCISCRVDREPRRRERPSDHAPVILELQ